MTEPVSSVLSPWSNFYMMTGSSAAALTGLMFVVITLVSGGERQRRTHDGIATFSTPTVVHFCAALFISASLAVPWRSLLEPAAVLGIAGLLGIGYVMRVTARTRSLSSYEPDVEDWSWYCVLPFAAYGLLLAGAIALPMLAGSAVFALAAGAIALIFIGIHNAWDVVTFIAIGQGGEPPASSAPPPAD